MAPRRFSPSHLSFAITVGYGAKLASLSLSLSLSLTLSACDRGPLPSLSPAGAQLSKNDKFDCLFLSWPRELLRRRRRRRRRRRPNAETKNDNLFHQLP